MRLDKQTLAWMVQDKKWMRILNPKYTSNIGIGENACLPDTRRSTYSTYTDPIDGKVKTITGDVWGFEKWHHSPQLINNQCECPRCNFDGKDDSWWYYPMPEQSQ